jgi:hypothetical protein
MSRHGQAACRLGECELAWHLMHMGTYGEALSGLRNIIKPVYDAIATGLEASAQHHVSFNILRQDEPWHYLHTVRRVAVEKLRDAGLQATKEGNRFALPLSGILVVYGGYVVRVLHAEGGEAGEAARVPVPGRSKAKQSFWRQDPFDGMKTENLLLLWQDKAGQLIEPMLLARPVGGDFRRHSLRLAWDGDVYRRMADMRAEDLNELEPKRKYLEMGDEEAG